MTPRLSEDEAEQRIKAIEQQIEALRMSLQDLVAIHPNPERARWLLREQAATRAALGAASRSALELIARWFPPNSPNDDGKVD